MQNLSSQFAPNTSQIIQNADSDSETALPMMQSNKTPFPIHSKHLLKGRMDGVNQYSYLDTVLTLTHPLSNRSINEATTTLLNGGKIIVTPTKVGYIIMTTDKAGLLKKYDAKQRAETKPSVVLCSSMEQLTSLAQTNATVLKFYQKHWDQDILMGCILPWNRQAYQDFLVQNKCDDRVSDARQTSCFVIKYGKPSEEISKNLWEDHNKLTFASSANMSGKGNMGRIENIGQRIESMSDYTIGANDFVASYQPNTPDNNRYHQGAMVSMVDDQGHLFDEDQGYAKLIRKGLDQRSIEKNLDAYFPQWQNSHGEYY